MMDVLRYFLGSICFLSLVTLVIYVFKNTRIFKGQIWHKLLIASAIAFITSFLLGAVDVFFLPGKGLLYIAFVIWVVGLLLLPVRGFIRWKSTQKAGAIPFRKSVKIFPDTLHYIVSFHLLAFIALPLWVSFIYNPFHVTSMWLDIAGLGVWALATLDLIIAQRKSRRTMQFITIAPNKKAIPEASNDVLTVIAYGKFINSFLTKANPSAGNPDTNILTEYFEYNPILFEGCRLSEDGTIDVEPILQNLDRIPEENRIPIICTLFSMFSYKLMNLYSAFVSSRWARKLLEECYLSIKEEFEDTSAVSNILSAMPKGILENEKLSLLSKKELEVRVRERTLELEESKEQLRMLKDFHEEIVTKAPVGIVRIDKEGRIVFVNPKAAEIIALPNGESITTKGWKMADIFSVREDQKTIGFEIASLEHMDLLAHNMPSEEIHTNLVLTSIYGKNTQTSVCVVPLYDKEQKFDGALFLIEDITERKLLEEGRQIIERLESVGTLAGGIAHDFNNLLTGIMGNIGLARRDVEPDSKAADRLAEAEKVSYRARDLTQQLLTFSTGGAPIKKTISIGGLVEDATAFASRGSSVRPEFSLPGDLWLVDADEGQLSQVINNIVINAHQAMPKGGIINIEAKNLVISRSGALPLPKGNYVEITIKDYGVGIVKEHLDKIFEPYFTTKQKGSGLGLATAYSIIRNHGGYITANSTPTVGTTLCIYLPVSKKTIPAKKEDVANTLIAGKGRVLVMDDQEVIRELLHDELTDAGFDVELTVDGTEAIERYTKAKELGQPFDAVIMDLTIPGGMGGKEAIKQLLEIDASAKVIVSSGYSTDPIMSDFKKYGFSGVATKPYKVGELEKTLRDLLKGEEVIKDS